MKKEPEQQQERWFHWVPTEATDITVTFRRFGYVPPSENPAYLRKWAEWKSKFNTTTEPEVSRVASVSNLRRAR
jgi:hypothetical protein